MRIIRSRLFRLVIFLISLGLLVTTPRSLYEMWTRRDYLGARQEARDKIAMENEALKKDLFEAQTPEYIERVAREKLGLIKEGETVVLLPKSGESESQESEQSHEQIAMWKKWWKLFF